jgi:hypothetical protein
MAQGFGCDSKRGGSCEGCVLQVCDKQKSQCQESDDEMEKVGWLIRFVEEGYPAIIVKCVLSTTRL